MRHTSKKGLPLLDDYLVNHRPREMRRPYVTGATLYTLTSRENIFSLQWRHNGSDSVSNHQPHDCLLNRLFKENIKAPRHRPVCGNSPGTDEFPAQMASYAENVSIWWRHHGYRSHLQEVVLNILKSYSCILILNMADCLRHFTRPGIGGVKSISSDPRRLFSVSDRQNTCYPLYITFIFDRCHRSSE